MAIIVVSGPSGVGKDTIIDRVLPLVPNLRHNASLTTRPPRASDKPGQYLYAASREQFMESVQAGELLEWAEYSGHLYGSLIPADGHSVLVIEVQGARQLMDRGIEATFIFIRPPGREEFEMLKHLEIRQRKRGDNDEEQIARRLETARMELNEAWRFDAQVVNEDLDAAVIAVAELVLEVIG